MNLRYAFRVGNNPKNLRVVYGNNYDQAAVWTARKLFGYGCTAKRIWGFPEFSGYFQAYLKISATGEIRAIGNPYHLQMLTDTNQARTAQEVFKIYDGLQYVRKCELK